MHTKDLIDQIYDSLEATLNELKSKPSDDAYRKVLELRTVVSQCRAYILFGIAKDVLPEPIWQSQDNGLFKETSALRAFDNYCTRLHAGDKEVVSATIEDAVKNREKDHRLLELLEEHAGSHYDFTSLENGLQERIEQLAVQQQKWIPFPPELDDSYAKHLRRGGYPEIKFVVFQNQAAFEYPDINLRALEHIAYMEGWPEILASFDAAKMTSQRITPEQFLGPTYDFAQRKLIVEGDTDRNSMFYWDEPQETAEHAINIHERQQVIEDGLSLYDQITRGYAEAFTDPVHGLQMTKGEKNAFFTDVNHTLFDNFNDELEILQWSTGWSSYFDPGHEWWGAYWWTVHNRTKNWVIVVAASGTD